MPLLDAANARPRETVELLDDAWRLYLADAPLLVALTFLFWLPAASCLVALIAAPGASAWLAALAAALLILTGLSSGACQEAFHSWAEGYPVTLLECLQAACKRWPFHLGSQSLALIAPAATLAFAVSPVLPGIARFFGAWLFGMIALLSAPFGLTRQPSFAAGKIRFWQAFVYAARAGGDHLGLALLLMLLRGIMLTFAVFNLHLMIHFILWTADDLGGLEVAYLGVLFSPGNGAYTLALCLFAWSLLVPFHEAAAFLFFMDLRARREGLDLWQRVETLFPARQQAKVGTILLAVCCGLLATTPARAEGTLEAVRGARQEIAAVRGEIDAAKPYPGGKRWVPRLAKVRQRLEQSAAEPDGFRWFRRAIEGFAERPQAQAVELLDDLDARLALVEDSLRPRQAKQGALTKEQIKNLVPPEQGAGRRPAPPAAAKDDPPPDKNKGENQGANFGGGPPAGVGVVSPVALGALAEPLLLMLVGVGLVALAGAIAFLVHRWYRDRAPAAPRQQGSLGKSTPDELPGPDRQDPADLWRQADERALGGDFLGAVRTLYLAVLALLHRGGFIRYERMRTNGEYADQLRLRTTLHQPFLGLTGLFELKWYGERACASDDYHRCRELAEEIRVGSSKKTDGAE
jgi:hypothetical protein